MLVLTTSPSAGKNKVYIGSDIEVTVLSVNRNNGQVKLGFEAPGHSVKRERVGVKTVRCGNR